MKNLKKILLTGTITLATLLTMSAVSKATTVKVIEDDVNMRRGTSTNSKIIEILSKGVECEYLGEEGNWYKIKYKEYIGYISKDYTKLIGEENSNKDKETQTNNKDNSTDNDKNSNNESQNANKDNSENTQKVQDDIKLVYKKFNKDTNIKILPLIHSSNIGQAKKSDEVLILTETLGWSYIQTNNISGWVRTDTLGESKTVTVGDTIQNDKPETTEKIGYINEDYVNMRKGAGTTYSVVKTLKLNTQVTILEESGKWYKVKSGENTGYVSKEYVSDSKKVTDRSLSESRTEKKEETNSSKNEKDTAKNVTNNKTTTTTNKENNKTSTTTNKTTTTVAQKNETNSKDKIKGTDVIAYAKKYLGHKYVWAGANPGGFDCSGFTMYVYKHFGVSLPHYTVSQYNSSKGKKITKQSNLKMGDIVFLTDYETGAPCGHCGIYISDGNFIHADSSVGYVNISNLNGIYKGRFCGALRVNGVGN